MAQRLALSLSAQPTLGQHKRSPARACTTRVCACTSFGRSERGQSLRPLQYREVTRSHNQCWQHHWGFRGYLLKLPSKDGKRPKEGKPASQGIVILSATLSSSGLLGPVVRDRCPLSTKAQQRAGEQCMQVSTADLLSAISAQIQRPLRGLSQEKDSAGKSRGKALERTQWLRVEGTSGGHLGKCPHSSRLPSSRQPRTMYWVDLEPCCIVARCTRKRN